MIREKDKNNEEGRKKKKTTHMEILKQTQKNSGPYKDQLNKRSQDTAQFRFQLIFLSFDSLSKRKYGKATSNEDEEG